MKERPILFSTPMVNAILQGRKTQTRRVVKSKNDLSDCEVAEQAADGSWIFWDKKSKFSDNTNRLYPTGGFVCPYGQAGDLLWVKESWFNPDYEPGKFRNPQLTYYKEKDKSIEWKWKSARFMPKVYARIWLEITNIRVERVQDITEEDAIAEGSQIPCSQLPKTCQQGTLTERTQFSRIWDSINGKKHPWESNPWVWIVEFKETSKQSGE